MHVCVISLHLCMSQKQESRLRRVRYLLRRVAWLRWMVLDLRARYVRLQVLYEAFSPGVLPEQPGSSEHE